MKTKHLITTALILISITGLNFASSNEWHCLIIDSDNKPYEASSDYKQTALNRAFEACKKNSQDPATCKLAQSRCVGGNQVNGSPDIQQVWRCSALDNQAVLWKAESSAGPDRALLRAKARCMRESPVPLTCYAYHMFCKNITKDL